MTATARSKLSDNVSLWLGHRLSLLIASPFWLLMLAAVLTLEAIRPTLETRRESIAFAWQWFWTDFIVWCWNPYPERSR